MSEALPPLRVGTRGSVLATTQAGQVAGRLAALTGRPTELVRIRTDGDTLAGPLAALGGTGVFVAALRVAVAQGRCEVAVHSLKDLPATLAAGLAVFTPIREDARDVLCAAPGVGLATLPRGARVGTGSPRRAAQLRAARPDLEIVDIRGNVDTRLARATGPARDLDGVILARAGLSRLGRLDAVAEILEPEVMMPAPGQGALAVEAGDEALADPALADALERIDHEPTRLAVTAERAVLERLGAGCAAPVGAHATVDGATLSLDAVVVSVDGTRRFARRACVELPEGQPAARERDDTARGLGVRVAEALLDDGAGAVVSP